MLFWQVLRQHVPQFQEMREGHPAQQDAQECWIQVLQALKTNLEAASGPSAQGSSMDASQAAVVRSKFVQKFMTGEMRSECVRLLRSWTRSNAYHSHRMKCPEAPEEEPTTTSDHFDDLKCHITAVRCHPPAYKGLRVPMLAQTTNYMATGIKDVRSMFRDGRAVLTDRTVSERYDREDQPDSRSNSGLREAVEDHSHASVRNQLHPEWPFVSELAAQLPHRRLPALLLAEVRDHPLFDCAA